MKRQRLSQLHCLIIARNRLMGLAATIALLCIVSACSNDKQLTPEQQVKATLESIEEAVEQRSVDSIMEHISDDYKDHQGKDKRGLKRLALAYILRNQNISVLTSIESIEFVSPGLVAVELRAAMAARDSDQQSSALGGIKADMQKVSTVLTLEGDTWKVSSVSWDRGSGYL